MYSVVKQIEIDFAHQIHKHPGACINIHGHTWIFEIEFQSPGLSHMGFVIDFKQVKAFLKRVHDLFDHSTVLSAKTLQQEAVESSLLALGAQLVGQSTHPSCAIRREMLKKIANAGVELVDESPWDAIAPFNYNGMRVTATSFVPTSERLAHWLFSAGEAQLDQWRQEQGNELQQRAVFVRRTRVYEQISAGNISYSDFFGM